MPKTVPPSPPAPSLTPWRHVIAMGAALAIPLGLVVTAFAWPATHATPHDVSLAVVGPDEVVHQVEAQLEVMQPGAFAVTAVATRDGAVDLIEDRGAYGALVFGEDGSIEAIVATQGSPALAQAIPQVATAIASAASGQPPTVTVTDAAPVPVDDPRGAGIAAAALPLVLAGILSAGAMCFRVTGIGRRLVGLAVAAVSVGLTVVGILHGWLGAFSGNVWSEALVAIMGIAATSFAITGLYSLAGRVGGFGIAALIFFLGNPLSAAGTAPELIPAGWSELGQTLPPGATVQAMRSVSGFGGAGVDLPLLILAAWIVAGLAFAWLAARKARRTN